MASMDPAPSRIGALPWPTVADRGLRIVLLLILVAAGCSVELTRNPADRGSADFVHDLRAHHVQTVEYDAGHGRVTWTTDWLHAYRMSLQETGTDGDPVPVSGDVQDSDLPFRTPDARAWLHQQIEDAGVRVPVAERNGDDPWPVAVVWQPLRVLAVVAFLISLALMLARRERWVANRWGWWWLFVIGGAGPLLYLALEPEPLWERPGAHPAARPRFTGFSGFRWAIVMAIAIGLLNFVIASVVN